MSRRMSDADLANSAAAVAWAEQHVTDAKSWRSAIGWAWIAAQIQKDIDREIRRRSRWWRR